MNLKTFLIALFVITTAAQTAFGQASNVYIIQNNIKVSGIKTDAQIDSLPLSGKQTTFQYFDGFFRPVQTVAQQASPQQNDIIQPMVYDKLGRQTTAYLPYTDGGTDGAYRNSAMTDQAAFYSSSTPNNLIARDGAPFTGQVFENSPLQRLLKAGMVGDGFQPGGTGTQHYKTVSYRSNVSTTDGNILRWNFDGTLTASTYYGDNTLAVTDGKDEDNVETRLYTDLTGHTVLKRQMHSGGNLDTYYIYNIAGMVSYIVPPKAIALLTAHSTYTLATAPLNTLAFHFIYDGRGRIITKTVPPGVTMNIVYDKWDRPVLMQDANMLVNNKWNYIKYDAKGRAVSQGIYTDATVGRTSQSGMQSYVNGLTVWYESRSGTLTNGGYYTNNAFPNTSANMVPLAYAYFDDYDLDQNGTDDYSYATQSDANLPNEEVATAAKLKGMPTIVSKTTMGAGITSGTWLISVTFYDKRLHPIQVQSNNHLYTGTPTLTDTKTVVPDFSGVPQTTKVVKKTGASAIVTVYTALTYDHMYRPNTISQKYNTGTMQQIAAYTYNELGQVVSKGLGLLAGGAVPDSLALTGTIAGTSVQIASRVITFNPVMSVPSGADFKAFIGDNYLQTVNYRYNIRGQLLSINNSKLANDGGVTSSDTDDLFGMQLFYDKAGDMGNTQQFNGKLTGIQWMSKDASGTKSYERSYKYSYDDLDRYTASNYAERTVAGTGSFGLNVGGFDESGIDFDENGNIVHLNRNSSTQGTNPGTQTVIDHLTYTYDPNNPNRLQKVTDGGTTSNYTGFGFRNLTGSTSNYGYDANDNLNSDPYKGISLDFNDLNRTKKIAVTTATNKYIDYTYDGNGVLLKKQSYINGTGGSPTIQTTTDYLDGFVYLNNTLSYFAMPEGRVVNISGTLKPEYIISDQQGNARISFQENPSSPGNAIVTQENSYYAYGLVMPNSPVSTPTNDNKHLYNGGSEWQNDYTDNLPDYYQTFYRNYDAAIGRFVGVDPMAEVAESMSTYHYAGNNPIMYNDPLGDYQFSPITDGDITQGFNTQAGNSWTDPGDLHRGFTPNPTNADGTTNWTIADPHYWDSTMNGGAGGGVTYGGAIYDAVTELLASGRSGTVSSKGVTSYINSADEAKQRVDAGVIGLIIAATGGTPPESTAAGAFSFAGVNQLASVQINADKFAYAGNIFHLPGANLPLNNGKNTQYANLCVFYASAAALGYYGVKKTGIGLLLDYQRKHQLTVKQRIDIEGVGIVPDNVFADVFCGRWEFPSKIIPALIAGSPVMGIYPEVLPNGTAGNHLVMITGLGFDYRTPYVGLYYTFWNSQNGVYQSKVAAVFTNTFIVTGSQ